ncbi:hypothetical protein GCM10023170_009260 [Phytohabitans houttuyneae]|uniref:Uncharacterized protein n=1 Tax=Phytohabitans houttuyneae TaxID=1076126 RepID=A0A6V8K715_9ACTN|nr:hypothetical protein Phou_034900 [Phytohabitans houttuyneae]
MGVADGIEYAGVSRSGGAGSRSSGVVPESPDAPGVPDEAPDGPGAPDAPAAADSRHGTSNADHGESVCGGLFGWRRSRGGPGMGAFTGTGNPGDDPAAGGTDPDAGGADPDAGGVEAGAGVPMAVAGGAEVGTGVP